MFSWSSICACLQTASTSGWGNLRRAVHWWTKKKDITVKKIRFPVTFLTFMWCYLYYVLIKYVYICRKNEIIPLTVGEICLFLAGHWFSATYRQHASVVVAETGGGNNNSSEQRENGCHCHHTHTYLLFLSEFDGLAFVTLLPCEAMVTTWRKTMQESSVPESSEWHTSLGLLRTLDSKIDRLVWANKLMMLVS